MAKVMSSGGGFMSNTEQSQTSCTS